MVTTTADEHMQSAKRHINDAISDISKVLNNPDMWGACMYDKEHLADRILALTKLLK